MRYDGKPLLLSFGESGLSDKEWTQCVQQVQTPIAWFSEHRRRPDALGAYDWPEPSLGLEMQNRFEKQAKTWPAAIPIVYPRFDDMYAEAGVSKGYPRIPDHQGKTFRQTLQRALATRPKIIQIATWNDWGEGTDIEPSDQMGYRDLEVLSAAFNPASKPEALRLPAKLLSLRRTPGLDKARLDQIAGLLASGKPSEAQVEMKQLAP